MTDEPAEIQEWLRRLKWSLAAIPSPERDDIIEEARAHLREAIASGQPASRALADFGDATAYARRFIDEMDVSGALGSQRTGAMLSVIGGRIHRSIAAALTSLVMLVLFLAVFTALTVLIFKLSDPVHTGLWQGSHEFFIGKIDDPAKAKDLLGNWIYPLVGFVMIAAWLIGRFVLVQALRRIARNR